MSDLREFLRQMEDRGEVLRVERSVSPHLEVSEALKENDGGRILLFESVKGYANRVVAGLCGTRGRLSFALGVPEEKLHDGLLGFIKKPLDPRCVKEAPVKQVSEKPRLTRLPILTHYERDGGRYLTSAIVATKTPDGDLENVSIHRLMVLDDNHLAIRIVPRHLYRICQIARLKGEKTVDVAIAIGLNPAVSIAASSPVPFGVSEYSVANSMLRGTFEVTPCESVDARAPAESELVFEGKILLDEEVNEGPFVDITGTYDIVRKQPVVEVIGVTHRENYLYQALLPGGMEHKLLMGVPYEAKIREAVGNVVPSVKDVRLTPGGCCWLHAVISIEKQVDGDAKNAILAAFAAHPSLKHVVLVDQDIDVTKLDEVEWAIATRFQGDEDVVVVGGARGSTLDPSADQELATTSKVGVDATRPYSKPREKFERARTGISVIGSRRSP